MQAVFLNNKTCERVHPVRICKDNPDAEPFYEGMDEPLREIHDIWINAVSESRWSLFSENCF